MSQADRPMRMKAAFIRTLGVANRTSLARARANPPPAAAWYNGTQALPSQTVVATTPYDCSGWLGQRYYLETQTWHTRPGADVTNSSTQLHMGACIPHRQMIAGDFPIDILLQKQNFPTNANATVSMKVRRPAYCVLEGGGGPCPGVTSARVALVRQH